MTKRITKLLLLFLLFTSGINAQTLRVEKVAEQLSKGKFKKICRGMSEEMKEVIDAKSLKQVWEATLAAAGSYKGYVEAQSTPNKSLSTSQSAILQFESLNLKLSVSENPDKELAGLLISPLSYSPPRYAQGVAVAKIDLPLKSGKYTMPGELIMPRSCGNCPVVVLVHGSGPNDMDETIGPNKPFYDLAMGLAAKGIATYRYDKRTKVYPEVLEGQFTLQDETINDAVAALQMMHSDSIEFSAVIALGHSLGAYAMPQVADSLPWLDGAILFSSNARRLENVIAYQYDYLNKLNDVVPSAEDQKTLDEVIQKINENSYPADAPAKEMLAYWPGTFWKGIHDYDPTEVLAKNSKTEFFIMQGEKDYQITMEDFTLWREKVGSKDNVKMMSFPGLTHLFTPTESETPGPLDYLSPGNVDEQVILEIADWIRFLGK